MIVALLILALLLYATLRHFIKPILWALILSMSLWPVYAWTLRRMPKHPIIASFVVTVGISLSIILPVAGLTIVLANEATALLDYLGETDLLATLHERFPAVERMLNQELGIGPDASVQGLFSALPKLVEKNRELLIEYLTQGARGLLSWFFSVIVCLVTTFMLFRHGTALGDEVHSVVRGVGGQRYETLLPGLRRTVKAVVYGIMMTAIAQGVLATAGFVVADVPFPFLLGLLTFFTSFLPIGPPLIWIPAGLWLLKERASPWPGVAMLAWGGGVVSTVDNVLRPLLIGQATKMSALLVFMGVVGGILSFGMVGMFLGPVVLAAAVALWKDWVRHQPGTAFFNVAALRRGNSQSGDEGEAPDGPGSSGDSSE